MKHKFRVLISAFLIAVTLFGCTQQKKKIETELKVVKISKYGNFVLECNIEAFRNFGFKEGDVVNVIVEDQTFEMPIGSAYSDVDTGSMLVRLDGEDDEVSVAINNGNFAQTSGIYTKEKTEEDPGYKWLLNEGHNELETLTIVLKETEGYLAQYQARNLTRTNNREDYAALSDEEFANYREIKTTGMAEGVLYRSSSPVDPDLGRNDIVMKAMEQDGVKTVLNIDDTFEEMTGYDTYEGSYYSNCAIINCALSYDYASEAFGADFVKIVRFMLANQRPVLIHCKEGKDRTGFICAVLEAYAGATIEEIESDYMATFSNYYGIKNGTETYDIILNSNLMKTLKTVFNTDDLANADLAQLSKTYLANAGLTADELVSLKAYLTNK